MGLSEPERCARFGRDIAEEPEVIARILNSYAAPSSLLREPRLATAAHSRILLTGMGSSYNACLAAAWWLRRGGVTAWAEFASEIEATPRNGDWVLVAVSQSGNTEETRRAMERFKESNDGLVIGVTNNEPSAVAAEADLALPMLAGPEGGLSAKSYIASVAILTLLAGRILGDPEGLRPADLIPAVAASDRALRDWPSQAERVAELLTDASAIHVIGSGTGWAAAEEGALIFKEGPAIGAEGMLTADFLHGAFYLVGERYTAILLPDSPAGWRDDEAREKVLGGGGRLISLGGRGPATLDYPLADMSAAARPLVEITPLELAAALLWERRLALSGSGGVVAR